MGSAMRGCAGIGVIRVDGQHDYPVFTWVTVKDELVLRHAMRVTAHLLYLRDRAAGVITCDDE